MLTDNDITRAKGLAEINHKVNVAISPENVMAQQIEAICGQVANYAAIHGRDQAIRLCEANIKGLNDEKVGAHADAMHDAYLMFYDLEKGVSQI